MVKKLTGEDRRSKINSHETDPFMGYEELTEAMGDAQFTSQAEVLARLLNRENLFISGLAGAGKTTVINRFKDLIQSEYENVYVAITASTGVAATLVNGSTIHSWSGLGIDQEPFDRSNLPRQVWGRRKLIENVDVLIIDEISMLPAYFFIKLDKLMKYIRRDQRPFGGVQLVLIGDFLQLPPVDRKSRTSDGDLVDCRYAIETGEWQAANIHYCFLDKSRRATDERLKKMLAEISNNKVTDFTRKLINEKLANQIEDENKTYTTLFTTNVNVDSYNLKKFNSNPNPAFTFTYKVNQYSAVKNPTKEEIEKAINHFGLSKELKFKLDDTVIVTKNVVDADDGTVLVANGSLAKIIDINDKRITIKLNNGLVRNIYPVTYSYKKVTVKEEFDRVTGKKKNVKREELIAEIEQIPLKLGYAITVHKSQGQTFDGVRVDLSKCFQPGLGYVALSRVRSIDDLIITDFSEEALKVDPKSQKITKFVKSKAYLERKNFQENIEENEQLLINNLMRMVIWSEFDQIKK